MARSTSEADTAREVGISTKTLQRYRDRADPVPHDLVNGRYFYTPSEVRTWMDAHGLTGQRGAAKVTPGTTGLVAQPAAPAPAAPAGVAAASSPAREDAVARENRMKADVAQKVAKAQVAQMELQAEKGLAQLGLDTKLRACRTNEDLASLGLEVGALVSTGKLTPERGRAINDLIKEARQNLKATQKAPPTLFEQALLATKDGAEMLRVFEGITDPERREKVKRYVEVLAEEDRVAGPAVDTVAPEQEAARG